MTVRFFPLRLPMVLLLAGLCLAPQLHAQNAAFPALGEDDPVAALSRYLRMLSSNPRDLNSLTGAGRAALAVGDANAALGFYARAEEIAPRNGRIKAGLASALVQMEQPRVALKLFDEATMLGVPAAEIAADRGLAHDLTGDNRRAQTDYTLAMRARDDDEVTRRLALSMAISGDRNGALTILDPLLRRRDAGAMRARAFVLALTGDHAGATNAVRLAMPGPQASVMANFLSRLEKLNPAQKALAVNFGYFPSDGRSYSAAELFADTRASAPTPLLPQATRPTRSSARTQALLTPRGPALRPGVTPPVYVNPARQVPAVAASAVEVLPPDHVLRAPVAGVAPEIPAPTVAAAGAATAAGTGPVTTPSVPTSVRPVDLAPSTPTVVRGLQASAGSTPRPIATRVGVTGGHAVSNPAIAAARITPARTAPVRLAATTPVKGATTVRPIKADVDMVEPKPAVAGGARAAIAAKTAAKTRSAAKADDAPSTTAPKGGKAVPASKGKSVVATTDPDKTTKTGTRTGAVSKTAAKAAADEKSVPGVKVATKDKAKPGADAKGKTDTAAKGKADTAAKAKAEAATAANDHPERHWVQIASGTDKANLDKAWASVKGKAPKLLNGQTTYTAPWRASNRLLVGPFKTQEEAQAQVNKLAKAGVSGIQFTSRAGANVQKVDKK